jgi:hypothetical protein
MASALTSYTQTVRTGGDAPSNQAEIAVGTLATPAQGFMLTTDGQFNYTTLGDQVVTDAAGTWAVGVQYAMGIKSIDASTTAVGKLFW